MLLGRVIGTVWATRKDPGLVGMTFLIVEELDLDGEPVGGFVVAADVLARLAAAHSADVEVEAGDGWHGSGTGAVRVEHDGDVLVVSEAGVWGPDGARPMRWRATSRWRLDGAALAVEHVRQGEPAAAVLDDGGAEWTCRAPHRCGADCYTVTLRIVGEAVVVAWAVSGPRKADRVVTRYA